MSDTQLVAFVLVSCQLFFLFVFGIVLHVFSDL